MLSSVEALLWGPLLLLLAACRQHELELFERVASLFAQSTVDRSSAVRLKVSKVSHHASEHLAEAVRLCCQHNEQQPSHGL